MEGDPSCLTIAITIIGRRIPLRSNPELDPNVRPPNPAWGWIAAAIFLVVVLAVAFGYGHRPGQLGTNTASNDIAPLAATYRPPRLLFRRQARELRRQGPRRLR